MTENQSNRTAPVISVTLLSVAVAVFSVAITITATKPEEITTVFDLGLKAGSLEGLLLVCIFSVTALIAFVSAEVLLRYSHTRLSIIAAHKRLAEVDSEIKSHAEILQSLTTKIEFTVIQNSVDQAQDPELLSKLQELHFKIEQLKRIETDTNFETTLDHQEPTTERTIN